MRWMMIVMLTGITFPFTTGTVAAQEEYEGWQFESQRHEIAPRSWLDQDMPFNGSPTLALAGDGQVGPDGRWVRTIAVDPNVHYRFQAHFQSRRVDEPARSLLARFSGKTPGDGPSDTRSIRPRCGRKALTAGAE